LIAGNVVMLRMSKLTDYGTMVLAELAASDTGWTTAGQVADATHLHPPPDSRLLTARGHAGLVVSTRGAQGGYALARPAADISAAEILDALEGPVAITECSSSHGVCDLESYCRVGTAWQRINSSIRKALEGVSLADLQNRRDALPSLRTELRDAAAAR
jgi:FeS assembly SUF system regulator